MAMMQTSPEIKSAARTAPVENNPEPRQMEYRIYQCLTVAAMLLLLASLWVF